jgi:hypothetical protein
MSDHQGQFAQQNQPVAFGYLITEQLPAWGVMRGQRARSQSSFLEKQADTLTSSQPSLRN